MAERYWSNNSLCIAVIGDLVGSKKLSNRAAAQELLRELIEHLNAEYADSLLAPFTISRGDEFQGLLERAAPLPDIVWDCELYLDRLGVRFGFGLGTLRTPLNSVPMETDGPAWWAARAAFESAA